MRTSMAILKLLSEDGVEDGGSRMVRGAVTGWWGARGRRPPARRGGAERGQAAAAAGGHIALASRHRSMWSRATSSMPGVLSLTPSKTMDSSYRFPSGPPEDCLVIRIGSEQHVRRTGVDRRQ
ncbi:hypothetical protein Shyhy02_65600 [Streptomyces hygroscopicus subsp. hygroscopicus]|nr:hypothetical protein Shyhy02_65600 [Streptomyces hygroscopicus subsp. hygroscopicus]